MDAVELSQIAEWCGGRLAGPSVMTSGIISKDTRTINTGDVYLALRGENHDGNAFAAQAAEKGACAAIMDNEAAVPPGLPVVLVPDALEALHNLAREWREKLSLRVVCITGSSGKTSTKEFTASVLGVRHRVVKTQGNLNNHIGLPLSILSAKSSDEVAVWEIGMNHPGEIAPLAALAKPDVAIITNIGVAHIEYMGSRLAIAEEKGALAAALDHKGVLILPRDEDFAAVIARRTKARMIATGLHGGSVTAYELEPNVDGTRFILRHGNISVPATVSVPGLHMVKNALLAVAAGLELGLTLSECAEGLAEAKLTSGRLERRTIRGVTVLDDTYNANPDSMIAALNALGSLPSSGRRIAVLGRMGELGDYAPEGYRRVGEAAAHSVDALITVGSETVAICETARADGLRDIFESRDVADAAQTLRGMAREGDIVLVKGSRAARMEQVISLFSN